MILQQAVNNFRGFIEQSITKGGGKAKTAMIRSSVPILNIHEAVKAELVARGVNPRLIHPPVGKRSPELKIAGSLKQKDQDICVSPNDITPKLEVLKAGLLKGVTDFYGEAFTKKTLTINVRSQISSIQKNFDTLYERTFSEAQNLHDRCPKMVLGEVYMIAVPEYNDKEFDNKKIAFKKISEGLVEKYIKSFQAITGRATTSKSFYQYEATCLLIVDFSQSDPKIYHSTAELKKDGLIPLLSDVKYEGLEWDTFFDKIISVYEARFGKGILS